MSVLGIEYYEFSKIADLDMGMQFKLCVFEVIVVTNPLFGW